jgi:hypothetical protein
MGSKRKGPRERPSLRAPIHSEIMGIKPVLFHDMPMQHDTESYLKSFALE